MDIALACTWTPRGDLPRLQQLLPMLEQVYSSIIIAVRSENADEVPSFNFPAQVILLQIPSPGWGRYLAIEKALTLKPNHLHCADMDMLLHWIERDPDEWRKIVALIPQTDCLIVGRSARAFQTRPQAIQQTEQIINLTFSHFFKRAMGFGLGLRGYSQQAAQCIMARSQPGRWGDAEWPLLIRQAGLKVDYVEANSADWETPDRYREQVADPLTRQNAAEAYDRDPAHWARRVQIARDIIQRGLDVLTEPDLNSDSVDQIANQR
jgi:hypothetical protein